MLRSLFTCQNTNKLITKYEYYFVLVVLCLILESITPVDIFFQTQFFSNGEWVISKTFHKEWKIFLYTTPKIIIGTIGGIFLLVFLFSLFSKSQSITAWRKPALFVAISIAIVPLCVAILKALTGVYSPVDLLSYGGKFPHIGFIEQFWSYGHSSGGKSFPAGHASGGFALISLYYLPLSNIRKNILFIIGLFAGWLMGLYQMGRGEHFFSHTLTTMFLALFLMTYLARRLKLVN